MFIPLPSDRFPERLVRCIAGLFLFGLGISMFLAAKVGMAPWDVFHQGMAKKLGITPLDQRFDPTFRSHPDVTYGAAGGSLGGGVSGLLTEPVEPPSFASASAAWLKWKPDSTGFTPGSKISHLTAHRACTGIPINKFADP